MPETLSPYNTANLPVGAAGKHVSPNACFQSALFGMVVRGKRKFRNGEKIVSFKGTTITFTGEQLDQGDLDVFIQAIHITAKEREKKNFRPNGLVHFSVRGFLSGIGRKPGKSGQLWLLSSIRRLSASNIEISMADRNLCTTYSVYGGSLINDYFYDPNNQKYFLRINSSLGALFDLGWTQLCWQQRLQLPGNLTKWLHGFYSSSRMYPMKVSSLRLLSGSRCKRLSDFRRQLKFSLNELLKIGMLSSWEINSEDKVHVSRPLKKS